jgi:hypothetical protein
MRRALTASALAAIALSMTPTANALPPDCERYGDKPCFTVCEILGDVNDAIQKLVVGPVPAPQFCQ